ncbi:MAG: S8 family serine peptidase [Oryzihumus sp.]
MGIPTATLGVLAAVALAGAPAVQAGGISPAWPPARTWHHLPDDPLLPTQWNLGAGTPPGAQHPRTTLDVPGAWDLTHCAGVTVAVLDTGVDLDHPDLAPHLLPGATFVNGTSSADDDQGHGTEVAGVIAAVTDNGTGIAGVCPEGRLLPVKVADSGGHTDDDEGDVLVAAGLRWAVDHGARVISMSLGVLPTPAMRGAVDYAHTHDVLVVAAVGNSGDSPNPWPAPADLPHVLAVGATDRGGERAAYSSAGPHDLVMAPGDGVPTTARGGGYSEGGYTSIATPQVAGVAALVRSVRPDLGADQVSRVIEATATPLPGQPDWSPTSGYGLVDAAAAVRAARGMPRHR